MVYQYLENDRGVRLAYHHVKAVTPGMPAVLFLGGYRSDMTGTKAIYLEEQCRARGQAYIRFDYSGHGASGGDFADGTIGLWKEEARAVLDHVVQGPALLVGSSMGGWIALLLALERPERVAGLVGIAAAPDFTRRMHDELMSDSQRRELDEQGFLRLPNHYSEEPYLITRALIADGANHCLLDRMHIFAAPMRLVQGMKDQDVPWQTAHRIRNAFQGRHAEVLLVEDGDHRLSRPQDLALIDRQVAILSRVADGEFIMPDGGLYP